MRDTWKKVFTGLFFLLVRSHDNHFRGWVTDIELLDHRRRVGGKEELLDVVLHDFVHAKGPVRGFGSVAEFFDGRDGIVYDFLFPFHIPRLRHNYCIR